MRVMDYFFFKKKDGLRRKVLIYGGMRAWRGHLCNDNGAPGNEELSATIRLSRRIYACFFVLFIH